MPGQVVVSAIVSVLERSTVGLFTWIQFITLGLPLPLDKRGVSADLTAVCSRTFSLEHVIQALFLFSLNYSGHRISK